MFRMRGISKAEFDLYTGDEVPPNGPGITGPGLTGQYDECSTGGGARQRTRGKHRLALGPS